MQRRSVHMTLDLSLKIQRAVGLLRSHKPVHGAFSGGKGSIAAKHLALLAEIPVEWHYHVTTIDPPEVVRFIRDHHPDVVFDRPKWGHMLLSRAQKKGVPSRVVRWCCDEYKEGGTPRGAVSVLGIRIAESRNRAKRWTDCAMKHFRSGATVVLPIRLWSDNDVWAFIHHYRLPYPEVYDEGFERLGCVGCPLASSKHRQREWARWPKIYAQWKTAFRLLWQRRHGTVDRNGNEWFPSRLFASWEEWFAWWDAGQGNVTEWLEKNKQRKDLVSTMIWEV